MARIKTDLKTLALRERDLRDQLRALKKQGRAIERAERQARTARVAEIAEKFGIVHLSDTVLASEFKRIAAAHPRSTESVEDADTVEDAKEEEEARTQPAETAQADSTAGEGRKRWPFSG